MGEQIKPVAGCIIDKHKGHCDPFMAADVLDPTVWDEPDVAKLYSQQAIDALRAEADGWKFQLDGLEHLRLRDNAYLLDRAERAEAEAEALIADAERYRWLRDLPDDSPHECIGNMPGDWWDEAIDAARKGAE